MTNSRRKLILWASPLLGIILASVCWLLFSSRHPTGPAEEKAKAMGYTSAARYNQILNLTPENPRPMDFTEAQFSLVQDVLEHDGVMAKIGAVSPLSFLRTAEQKHRAVQIMKPYIHEKDTDRAIYSVLRDYASGNGRPAIEELAQDPDPLIAQTAKAILSNVHSSKNIKSRKA